MAFAPVLAQLSRECGLAEPLVGDAALAEQAAHAGRMLEAAYKGGDRELALIWQQAMYAIVNLRRSRRLGADTHTGGANLGG